MKRKNVMRTVVCFAFFTLAICGPGETLAGSAVGEPLKVGGIFDMTGPTSPIGVPFANGAAEYFSYVNKQGGINGQKIELISIDYAYDIQKSASAYSRLTDKENILGLLGWGSVDMPLIMKKAVQINLPIIAAASRGDAVVGKFNPCVFSIAGTYSQELITGLSWLKMDSKKRGISRPKLGLLYSEPGRESVKAVARACEKLGIDLVSKEFVSERSIGAASHIARVKRAGCEYIWTLMTLRPLNVIFKEAQKIDYDPQFFGTFFCANEALFKMAAKHPHKLIIASPVAFINQPNVPGIKIIREFTGKSDLLSQFIAGWVGSMVLAKGIEKGGVNSGMSVSEARKAIIDGLEKLRNDNMDGLTAPMTFTKTDHIGTKGFRLYRADWKLGEFIEVQGDFRPVK